MNNLIGKNAILYRRVSTTDQKIYGNSLNAQRDSLRDFCLKNSINIMKEFQEDYSAKNFDRPEWKKLIDFAQKNKNSIDYLLVVDWDRFSRNTFEALGVINDFKEMHIEVNCIGKWINYDDPSQIIMQLMYLGMPEVDNKIRSEKVRIGMRQGLKEGRYNVKPPCGYMPGKDELGKPLIQPHPTEAPLIKKIFELFATGIYSQNEIRNMAEFKVLNISRSNLSTILKNILYAGKVRVKAFKNEPEEIVSGLHEPLIELSIFYKTQEILKSKSRYKNKPQKQNEILFLRGHLKCNKCGGNLTGSGSKSKTGKKHFYYHCNSRNGCKERFKIKDAHNQLITIFESLKPSEEMQELFTLVLEDNYHNSKAGKIKQINEVKNEINRLKSREESLVSRLLDGTIENETYKSYASKIKEEIMSKESQLISLNDYQDDLREYINFGLNLLTNLDTFFNSADVVIKQKLLSSIFKEKLEFTGTKYRTPKYKEAFQYIFNNISELEKLKTKKGDNPEKVSPFVQKTGLEPVRTFLSTGF
jgi:site-specific DNA recombinase